VRVPPPSGSPPTPRAGPSRPSADDVILMDLRMPVMDGITATLPCRYLFRFQIWSGRAIELQCVDRFFLNIFSL